MSAPRLLIGTATPNGIVAAAHLSSMLGMVSRLHGSGISTIHRHIDGPSLPLQRDVLAADLLSSDASHLLLLDGDLAFQPDLGERLLALAAPLAGVAYALAGPDLAKTGQLAATHGIEAALALASPWNVRPIEGRISVTDGRARVASVGPGCLLVARTCLEALSAGGLPHYSVFDGRRRVTAFFRSPGPTRQDPVLQDRLCRLWTAAGGEVWIDVDAQVSRLSTFRFGAPFSEYLRAVRPRAAAKPAALAAALEVAS